MVRPRSREMFGLVLRLVMVAACAFPFAGNRSTAALLSLPVAGNQLPSSPVRESEEEESERSEDAKVRPGQRTEAPHTATIAPSVRLTFAPCRLNCAYSDFSNPADPFRNGLGTPYRC